MLSAGDGSDGGITRFQSVPATWLESLLLSDENIIIDPIKSDQPPPITKTDFLDPNLILPDSCFLQRNSYPVEFLSNINNSGNYLSSYRIPAKGYYDDYLSSSLNIEQFRDICFEDSQMAFTLQMGDDQSGLLDIEMEKIAKDSAPFKVRGFATHPRSIAERVRRSRISDRIRKLQELVPNMHKQTNTVDMLDEAVEYVKFL